MANEQQLGEFINNLVDDLQSGAITTEEAIVAASQYEYIRALFSQKAQDLAQKTSEGDEVLKTELITLFEETKGRLKELPAFSSQAPDEAKDEVFIKKTATLERFAFEAVRKEKSTKLSAKKETRRAFIHSLVNQYSARTKKVVGETTMTSFVDSALSSSSRELSQSAAQERFIKEVSKGLNMSDPAFEKTLESSIATDTTKTIINSWKDARAEQEALNTLYTHAGIARPDVVVDAFVHASDQMPLADVSLHAVKLAQTAGALETLGNKQPQIKGPFFSNSNAKGITKGAQQAADGILSLVGEPLREIIIKEKINGTLRNAFSGANRLADKLGENFIHSSVFAMVSQNILKGSNEKPSMSQPTNVFSDVFGAVFRGPLNYPTTQGAKDNLYTYYELSRANSNVPKGLSFMGPNIMPWHLNGELLNKANKSTIWYPSIGFGALGSLGGNALTNMFDRFVGFAFAGPSITRQLHASRRAAAIPIPLSEDLPTLLSIFVISMIVILFVFPTFLNVPHLSMVQKMSALLVSLNQKEGNQGIDGGKSVDCTKTPNDKLCSFKSCPGCKWPTSGYITQGPLVTCDKKFSHAAGNDANGVDIATIGSPETPVYSIREGVVVTFNNTCGVGSIGNNCGGGPGYGGYGNYVVIRSTDGYTMMFSHLKKTINPSIKMGATITAGTQIGWMDNSGNTSGQHLHFGVLSGQSVLDLLPDQPNKKSDILGCATRSLLCFAAGKVCPSSPVSTQ